MSTLHGVPVEEIRDNLSRRYGRSLATEELWQAGLVWYRDARDEVVSAITDIVGVAPDNAGIARGAECLAILSPRCPWEVNLAAFRSLLRQDGPVAQFLPRNFWKAHKHWLWGDERITTRKVATFATGVRRGGETQAVCLDTHMLRAALGREPSELELGRHFRNTAGCYDTLADIVRGLAQQEGIYPAQYQAIVWLVQRG